MQTLTDKTMNIKQFAQYALLMDAEKRQLAINNLNHGLANETRWNSEHKKQVKALVKFLESGSNDISDLTSYLPFV